MARSAGKKTPKATPSTVKTSSSSATSATGPPTPFVLPTHEIAASFLSTLPTSHIYLLHVDPTPVALKRRVFLVPVCMNIFIVLLIVLRAYYALPTYGALLLATLGYDSVASVDTENAGYPDLFGVMVGRTLMFLGDYALMSFLGSWPWNFVFGLARNRYSSPVKWRTGLGGFLEGEIIVRSSREWDQSLLPNWTLDDELTLKHKIMPAMDRNYLAKTGLTLLDNEWELDYAAMIKAHELVSAGKLSLADFDKAVLVHYPPSKGPHGGWMIWHVYKSGESKTAEQRDTLSKFKDKLMAMGHEDLFYRWVELVQYESSMPGGFTQGRQANVMREARRMFQEKGVDFGKFWEEVGGSQGMPGLSG